MAITECQGHKIVDHEHNNSLLHLNLVSRPIPPCSALYPFYEYRTLDSRMAFCSIYPLARGSPHASCPAVLHMKKTSTVPSISDFSRYCTVPLNVDI